MITDPVYEGKSLAGLIDLVKSREIPADGTVLYAHLSGRPALNAYGGLFRYWSSAPIRRPCQLPAVGFARPARHCMMIAETR